MLDSLLFETSNHFNDYSNVKSTCLYGENENKKDVRCSIIIPTYKRQSLLVQAVKSALRQEYNGIYEIIIVDNTDDDSYLETVRWLKNLNDSRISYFHNEKNIGMFGNWNRGIELSRGDWFVILNDDDMLCCDYLQTMTTIVSLLPYETAILACSHFEMSNDKEQKGIMLKRYNENQWHKVKKAISVLRHDMYFGSYISLVGAFINRSLTIKLGGFKEYYYPISDFVFILNHSFSGNKIYYIKKELTIYRIESNESRKFRTIKLFMKYQLEIKKAIYNKYRYLPPKIASRFENVQLYVYEEQLAKKWLNNNEENRKRLENLNDELRLKKPYCIETLIFKIYARIRYSYFFHFRGGIHL